jgi:hypothetical protein
MADNNSSNVVAILGIVVIVIFVGVILFWLFGGGSPLVPHKTTTVIEAPKIENPVKTTPVPSNAQ